MTNEQQGSEMLVSTCAFARSGKDTFCDALVNNHGFIKIGWADPLYEMAVKLNPRLYIGYFRWSRLSTIVRRLGWTEAKKIPSVRHYLQWLGTDVVRNILGEDAWVNATVPRIQQLMREKKHVAVTNTRFENEAKAIENLGGTLIKITRPGYGPVNEHISDQGLAFSYASITVVNDGTVADLEIAASEVVSTLTESPSIDSQSSMLLFERTVDRGIAKAAEFIMTVSAPEYCDLKSFCTRNAANIVRDMDDDEEVYVINVAGQECGTITYVDGMIVAEVSVAR